MKPDFAKAVDPVMLAMLDLMDRIKRNAVTNVKAEHSRLRQLIDAGERAVPQRAEEWDLARYALVAWIDEVLSLRDWPGRQTWIEDQLQFKYYRSKIAHENFYRKAKEAAEQVHKDALEVYFLCVVMGFRGVYGGSELSHPRDLGLPDKLEDWLRQQRDWINSAPAAPPEVRGQAGSHFAAPLNGRFEVLRSGLAFLAVLMLTLLCSWIYFNQVSQPGT